jgi:ParB-like chromosome segregation protein Spo0J
MENEFKKEVKMTDIQVKKVSIDKLVPWDKNPRKHGSDIQNIIKSMEKFGWTNPILVQKDTLRVIAGHGRVQAAKEKGIKEVPIIELDLNDKEAEAYTIADNRLAELSKWDAEVLVKQLQAMEQEERLITGFDDVSFEKLLGDIGDQEINPEVRFTEELMEAHNYVVLYCDNEISWLQLQTLYPLENVKALDSKPGFKKQGMGRVVKWDDFIKKIGMQYENK